MIYFSIFRVSTRLVGSLLVILPDLHVLIFIMFQDQTINISLKLTLLGQQVFDLY